ncbi:hypothetical protein Bca4012_020175 [Brassica carinata]|uniref:Uncharacterized protein n=1 Tax=Brassica carinata TaxID=52824 RepID=A0A8X8BD23_BRACI|nr:hypothetical protein Bca52824_001412 [Brassica carinata]
MLMSNANRAKRKSRRLDEAKGKEFANVYFKVEYGERISEFDSYAKNQRKERKDGKIGGECKKIVNSRYLEDGQEVKAVQR